MSVRIAVTGMGVISPIGNDVDTFWQSLVAGKSGVSILDRFPIDKLRTDVAAVVRDFDIGDAMDEKEKSLHGRVTKMLVGAASQALRQAALPESYDRDRVGVLLGPGQAPVELLDENFAKVAERGVRVVSPFFVPTVMPNAAAALVSIRHQFRGPNFSLASACATGVHSLAVGAMMILTGEADAMVVGGGEAAIVPSCVAAFGNARALARSIEGDATRASRPYDTGRNGFVMGEGAGALVLEREDLARARGATIYGLLSGWGMSGDAEHIVRPHPEGRGVALAVKAALKRAEITPEQLGYINPHATSTPQGDIAEYSALRASLGDSLSKTPVSATKSILGHLLGGAGAVESIATVLSLHHGVAHPSLNLDNKDPIFELDIVTSARELKIQHALKTSAGFGGHNAALVFSRP
ncbi:MAG: beta-ketoacyl-[acyl-carrier-protein] synthase family protein [Polyangiaceae bacterium]